MLAAGQLAVQYRKRWRASKAARSALAREHANGHNTSEQPVAAQLRQEFELQPEAEPSLFVQHDADQPRKASYTILSAAMKKKSSLGQHNEAARRGSYERFTTELEAKMANPPSDVVEYNSLLQARVKELIAAVALRGTLADHEHKERLEYEKRLGFLEIALSGAERDGQLAKNDAAAWRKRAELLEGELDKMHRRLRLAKSPMPEAPARVDEVTTTTTSVSGNAVAVRMLVGLGFVESDVREALELCQGDAERACVFFPPAHMHT